MTDFERGVEAMRTIAIKICEEAKKHGEQHKNDQRYDHANGADECLCEIKYAEVK